MNNSMRIARASHVAFAAIMIGFGILGLVKGDLTVLWEPVPQTIPARDVLVYLCAVISLASGIGLLWQRTAAVAARVLLAFFLLWLLAWRLPGLFRLSLVEGTWSCGKTLIMTGAAWVLFVWFATDTDRQRLGFATGDKGLCIARVLYALGLIPFGLAHFLYPKPTAALVPGWLPWHMAWAYLTGATFIAASVAMLIGVYARLAAALSTLQMGLFGLLVWVPIVATGTLTAFQWGEVVITVALTAAGWVVTDSYRGTPWLAVGRRRTTESKT